MGDRFVYNSLKDATIKIQSPATSGAIHCAEDPGRVTVNSLCIVRELTQVRTASFAEVEPEQDQDDTGDDEEQPHEIELFDVLA